MRDFRHSVPIHPDKDGFTGRECPESNCKKYFKIEFGTGLKEITHCICPYCGHKAEHSEFFTQAQINYAVSVGTNKLFRHIAPEFKKLEQKIGGGLFSIEMKIDTSSLRVPIKHYYEKELETVVICDHCTLRYAIYGLYGYCPDCGVHNSLQIFQTNLAVIQKYVDLAETSVPEVAERLLGDAMENLVSEFQAFGKVTIDVLGTRVEIKDTSNLPGFQNLEHARKWFQSERGVDIAIDLAPNEWSAVLRCFQKRHVLTHCAGVADENYVAKAHDPYAVVGRKIRIEKEEVMNLIGQLGRISNRICEAGNLTRNLET